MAAAVCALWKKVGRVRCSKEDCIADKCRRLLYCQFHALMLHQKVVQVYRKQEMVSNVSLLEDTALESRVLGKLPSVWKRYIKYLPKRLHFVIPSDHREYGKRHLDAFWSNRSLSSCICILLFSLSLSFSLLFQLCLYF